MVRELELWVASSEVVRAVKKAFMVYCHRREMWNELGRQKREELSFSVYKGQVAQYHPSCTKAFQYAV